MKVLKLNHGRFVIVDGADYEAVRQHKWRYHWPPGNRHGYAVTSIKQPDGTWSTTNYLHRMLMNPPAGMVVDHINGKRWDCRRKNLRNVTPYENSQNPATIGNCRGKKLPKVIYL